MSPKIPSDIPSDPTEAAKPSPKLKTLRERVREAAEPAPGDSVSLLPAITAILTVSAAYLYFTGYIFEYFYYRGFGVSVDSLDISSQYYFIRAYTVFETPLGAIVLGCLALVVSGYATHKIRRGLLLVCMIAAFPALFFIAENAARKTSILDRTHPSYGRVRFSVKPGKIDSVPDAVAKLGGEDDGFYLLLGTKDRIIVFQQPDPIAGMPRAANVYTLLRSDLNWSEVVVP